jgi:DNA-binding beta-propeller fold protein YncE
MKISRHLFILALVLCATAFAVQVQAKDLVFYLGYDMVQVINTSNYHITDIPIKGSVRDTAFTANGRYFYVTGSRRFIEKIDTHTLKLVHTMKVQSDGWQDRFIFGMALTKDGRYAYVNLHERKVVNGSDPVVGHEVAEIDLNTGRVVRSIKVPWGVASLALVKNDSTLYAIGQDIYAIDVSKPKMAITKTIPEFKKGINMLAFWTYVRENGGIWLSPYYTPTGWGLFSINTHNGKIAQTPIKGVPLFAYGAVYSPDHKKAYSIMDNVGVINLQTRTVTKVVPNQQGTCYGDVLSSDGHRLFVGGGGPTMTVYDTSTMKPIRELSMKTDGMGMRLLKE